MPFLAIPFLSSFSFLPSPFSSHFASSSLSRIYIYWQRVLQAHPEQRVRLGQGGGPRTLCVLQATKEKMKTGTWECTEGKEGRERKEEKEGKGRKGRKGKEGEGRRRKDDEHATCGVEWGGMVGWWCRFGSWGRHDVRCATYPLFPEKKSCHFREGIFAAETRSRQNGCL